MPILGRVIKAAVGLSDALRNEDAPLDAQLRQLENLLAKARNTAFGKYYNFEKILDAADPMEAFQKAVPVHDYDKIHQRWWAQQQHEPDITWPGKPGFFALSSGTTGKESKRIPVTDDMLESIRSVSIDQVRSLSNYELPAEIFEKDILALGSSSNLKERQGHYEGEISGINAHEAPDWFDFFYKPGRTIAAINDWDNRIEAIVEKAPEWDVSAIVGIPSWILMMIRQIIDRYELNTIHDLWPSLTLYATGGVAFEPFRESFNKVTARPLVIQDTYLASEGYFAFTARPDTQAMRLALDNGIYYEFIPFDERGFDEQGNMLKNPEVVPIDKVAKEQDYALIISTVSGTWRYLIGDTVRFTDTDLMEIVISGRTKYFLNVVGSQLSEEKMNAAIGRLGEETGVEINEFGVTALQDEQEEYYHQWILGVEGELNEEQAATLLDTYLKELNKNYAVARDKALKGVVVKVLPVQELYGWIESKKKKGGQIKFPKILKPEQAKELLSLKETSGSIK